MINPFSRIPFSKQMAAAVAGIFLLKTTLTVLAPAAPESDFGHWVTLAAQITGLIQSGTFSNPTVYTGMGVFLVPFYAIWTALPVPHPPGAEALASQWSTSGITLVFLMKLPILLSDLLAGILIASIIRKTSVGSLASKAFFIWYLNPYAFYLMEYSGTFDIVPTVLLLASVLLAIKNNWSGAGFSISLATILRLYPVFAFPALAYYAFHQPSRRATIHIIIGFLFPFIATVLALAAVTGSVSASLNAILSLPSRAPWLGLFYAFPVGQYLALASIVVPVQVYLIVTRWKTRRGLVADSVLVSVLALLLASYHQPYHFTWAIPLLTLFLVMNGDSILLYSVLFVGAFLASLGFDTTNSTLIILQPLFAAIFYAAKATFIIKINRNAISNSSNSHGPTLVESHR